MFAIGVAALLAAAAACGGGATTIPGDGDTPTPTAEQPRATETPVTPGSEPRTLAAGQFRLPAANAFGEPGFHEVLAASHTLEGVLGNTAGMMLVVALRDMNRPQQICSREHPLSGCATVDWSDSPSRAKVPAGGVFDNSVTVELESGPRTFYLSESGGLNDGPDGFDPG